MKKFLLLMAAFVLTLTLAGCGEEETELPTLPTEITDINDVDMYLGRDDVQYVDVRDFDEKMANGYIEGFDAIPLRDYLFDTGTVVKAAATGWEFTAGDIKTEAVVRALFDADKTIFVMCAAGSRAGYVVAALESLGYTAVNIGGYNSYTGDHNVTGDGSYTLSPAPKGMYTPGVYFGESNGYLAVITVGERGAITNVAIDAIYCFEIKVDGASQDPKEYSSCTTKQTLGDDYGMLNAVPGEGYGSDNYEWYQEANMMAAAVLANQGWNADWAITDGHFVADDAEVVADGIVGVTVSVGGFQAAVEDALLQATPAS